MTILKAGPCEDGDAAKKMIHALLDPLYRMFVYCKTDLSRSYLQDGGSALVLFVLHFRKFCVVQKKDAPTLAALLHPVIAFLMRRDEQ